MANRDEVASQIRFALSRLTERNAHHEFEHLCRHFAMRFICSNILPATGPVSAGGDQGRDFETFHTYLRRELGPHGPFLGLVSEGAIAFVCTIQANGVENKLAKDIEKICNSGHPVHEVKAFTAQAVSVNTRHRLQKKTLETHNLRLELFDAEALSEQLSRPDAFWIAVRFLSLPAELCPLLSEDEAISSAYMDLRDRWREKGSPCLTFGDFFDLKLGLREATMEPTARPDLPLWLGLIRQMLADASLPLSLRQRAQYELIVASLRGLGNLQHVDDVLREFLDHSLTETEPARLEDASVLLQYAAGAARYRVTSFSATDLAVWNEQLRNRVEELLPNATPHVRASLLFTLGGLGIHRALSDKQISDADLDPSRMPPRKRHISSIPLPKGVLLAEEDFVDLQSTLSAWTKLAESLEKTPLFPVDLLSGFLKLLVPVLANVSEWRALVDLVDSANERVAGKNAVAMNACDRASAFRDTNRLLESLDEFHRAKFEWWSGDSVRKSLIAMLEIARLYLELRLPAAAKSHALAVAYVADTKGDDGLADLVPIGLFMAASADYLSGAWCCATELIDLGIDAQHFYAEAGLDSDKHNQVEKAAGDLLDISECAQDVDQSLASSIKTVAKRIGVHETFNELVPKIHSNHEGSWISSGKAVLTGPPFSDLGKTRYIHFSALGIDWTIESANETDSVHMAEQLATVAQVMLAALAREDLCLVPTYINVKVEHQRRGSPGFDEQVKVLRENDRRQWVVRLEPATNSSSDDSELIEKELLETVSQILFSVSLLSEANFHSAMDSVFQRWRSHRLSPVRPYDELAAYFTKDSGVQIERGCFETPWDCVNGSCKGHNELRWQDGPGPTFSRERANELLCNRYVTLESCLRNTVPTLRQSAEFSEMVAALRAQDWLDWHILTGIHNIVINYRNPLTDRILRSEKERQEWEREARSPESDAGQDIPVDLFTLESLQENRVTAMFSLLKHWGLELHEEMPDFQGVERLLADRYGYWDDDVPHNNSFPDASTG